MSSSRRLDRRRTSCSSRRLDRRTSCSSRRLDRRTSCSSRRLDRRTSCSSRRLDRRRTSCSSSNSSRETHVLAVEMRIVVSPPCPNIFPSPLLTSILKPQSRYRVSHSSSLPPFLLSFSLVCSLFLGTLLFTLSLICRQRVDLNTCG